MGSVKRDLEHRWAREEVALDILVEAGLCVRCPTCGIVVDDDTSDLTDAFKLASYLFKRKDQRLADFTSQHDLTDTIKTAVQNIAETCTCVWDGEGMTADMIKALHH